MLRLLPAAAAAALPPPANPLPPPRPRRRAQGYVIQGLFAAPRGTFSVGSLALYSAAYYLLAALTYGAFIPSGLFTARRARSARAR